MSFGSMIGGSALGSGLGHIFESADSLHMFEAENSAFAVADPLGFGFGKVLGHSEKKKAQKQLAYQQQLMQAQYDYQKRAALEMPSLVRQGLEDAGYNALLALGNTGGVSSAPNVPSGGDYPHENQRRQTNMLITSALETQAAQREKIENDIKLDKAKTVIDAVKSLGSLAVSGIGTYLGVKGLTKFGKFGKLGKNVASSTGKGVIDIPLKNAASASSAAGAAASLFTRALTPALAGGLYATGQYELGKHLERKGYNPTKLFNVKKRWEREMFPLRSDAPAKKRRHN